eukprot:2070844-Alexandrium_andersonii.AAC.1
MSASLVGSEMCIRDSFRPRPPPLGSSTVHAARGGGGGRCLQPSYAAASVSYTHLTLPTICSV